MDRRHLARVRHRHGGLRGRRRRGEPVTDHRVPAGARRGAHGDHGRDRTWSTGGSGDDAISVGQAFRDGERWLIDATDPNIEGIVAEIRLNQAIEEGDVALAGTLKIRGTGAWAVTCIGP
jgi:hypothetical protein